MKENRRGDAAVHSWAGVRQAYFTVRDIASGDRRAIESGTGNGVFEETKRLKERDKAGAG